MQNNELTLRSNLMAGILIKKDAIKCNIGNFYINNNECRKILFEKNDKNVAVDLLYNSPYYEIDGYENLGNSVSSDFIITDAIELNSLLKYHCYQESLNKYDILRIYNQFFMKNKEKFYLKHCNLFGLSVKMEKMNVFCNSKFYEIKLKNVTNNINEHPINKECFNLINIIKYSRKPTKSEQKNIKIKSKVLILSD